MTNPEHDHVVACDDCGWEGKPCPLRSYAFKNDRSLCTFLGGSDSGPPPESRVCDKHPEMLSLNRVSLARGQEADQLKVLRNRHSYKEWLAAYTHYALPLAVRLKTELELLRQRVAFKHYIGYETPLFNRLFAKEFKPKGVGLKPGDSTSFRARALKGGPTFLNWSNPERVALCPVFSQSSYEHKNEVVFEEAWDLGILTKNTQFEYEIHESGIGFFDDTGLLEILKAHNGHKILIEWEWTVTQDYDGDCDLYIDDVKFIRRL